MKKLALVQLNELNFDLIEKYLEAGFHLPFFSSLLSTGVLTTVAEDDYDNLEPWIQWTSVYTGLRFAEHNNFRLGDVCSAEHKQIFEVIESKGVRVGAICPMNADNRLVAPAFFIPDPLDTNSA